MGYYGFSRTKQLEDKTPKGDCEGDGPMDEDDADGGVKAAGGSAKKRREVEVGKVVPVTHLQSSKMKTVLVQRRKLLHRSNALLNLQR